MDIPTVVRTVLVSATVFLPVAAAALALSFLGTRGVAPDPWRKRLRGLLVLASVAVAGVATAMLWVGEGAMATLRGILVTLAMPLVAYLVVLATDDWMSQHIQDDAARLKTRKALIYVGTLIVALTLLKVWVLRGEVNYTTVLSVVGAGLALALHQVLLCVTGWFVLVIHRHYDVGDRIQIGEVKGDVSDVGILHTTLVEFGGWVDADQSTGRLVSVPNSQIFTQPIYNYTRGFEFIWHEITVLITFESNWRKAEELMLGFAQDGVEAMQERFRSQIRHMTRKYMILYQHITPIVYRRILDSGVRLTLRYLTEPKRRRATEADLTARILEAFAREPDIDFAYPTTRFYDATREGKTKVPRPEESGDSQAPTGPPT